MARRADHGLGAVCPSRPASSSALRSDGGRREIRFTVGDGPDHHPRRRRAAVPRAVPLPQGLFDFVEGVIRWHNRVIAYAWVLVTDRYPPFRLAR
jgi:hypothetical protein